MQRLTLHLSAYFRYSLKSEAEQVTLREELAHVENYLEIQKIRYPYNLRVTLDIEPGTTGIGVPPLILQTFIENSIKYAVNMDEVTEIGITARKAAGEGESCLELCVFDDGPGFPQSVLEALENGQRIDGGGREHLGIYNVQQRLWLIYQGYGDISFENREPHGALIKIWIPAEKEQEEEI